MSGSAVLLHLAGAVALLLWATRIVRTGVERAYGELLRAKLGGTLNNVFLAIPVGAALALAFQSSTAVVLLVGSFAGAGIVPGAAGLVAVLGADLGSALMVGLLSLDLSLVAPVALLFGTVTFFNAKENLWQQSGRILVGVGLLLLSLRLIGEATGPLKESDLLPLIITYLANDLVTVFILGALFTWLLHSSIAFVLLAAAFASRGIVPGELGVVLVLGANLGGGLIAAALSRTMSPAGRAIPLGNLALRGLAALIVLLLVLWVPLPLHLLGENPGSQLIYAHIIFNAFLVVVATPFAKPVHALVEKMLSRKVPPPAQTSPDTLEASMLDPAALGTPSRALANVARAVVGLCDMIEVMLETIMELYSEPDPARIESLAALDANIHRRHAAIKLYLARITTREMTEQEAERAEELLNACVSLEQVSDIIARNMMTHVEVKRDRKLVFTKEGWEELSNLHALVLANARLAFNVLLTRDPATALALVREKDRLRNLERETSRRHFERLREGTTKSIETSSLHLDTVRDLKQINSLLAPLAYPVLEEHGLLLNSRLIDTEEPSLPGVM